MKPPPPHCLAHLVRPSDQHSVCATFACGPTCPTVCPHDYTARPESIVDIVKVNACACSECTGHGPHTAQVGFENSHPAAATSGAVAFYACTVSDAFHECGRVARVFVVVPVGKGSGAGASPVWKSCTPTWYGCRFRG